MLFLLILLRKKCSNPETCPDSCHGPLDVRAHVTLKPYLPNRSLLSIRRHLRFDPHYLGRLCVDKIFSCLLSTFHKLKIKYDRSHKSPSATLGASWGAAFSPGVKAIVFIQSSSRCMISSEKGNDSTLLPQRLVMSGRPANRLGET